MKAKKRQRPLDLSGQHDVLGSASAAATTQARKGAAPKSARPAPREPAPALAASIDEAPAPAAPVFDAPLPEFFTSPRPTPDVFAPLPPPESLWQDPPPPPAPAAAVEDAREMRVSNGVYLVTGLAALAWAGTLVAYVVGYNRHVGAVANGPLQVAVIGALALLPAVFMGLAAFAIREGTRLASEARRARTLSDELILPMAAAAAQAGGAAFHIREEIERATTAAEAARRQLAELNSALSGESERLQHAVADAERAARVVRETLGQERTGLAELAASLTGQVQGATDAIARQSRLVAETSDLAQAHMQEAEAALAARAADLATTAAGIGGAIAQAGDAVEAHAKRFEEAGGGLGERLQAIEGRLAEQRQALDALFGELAQQQETMASRIEGQRTQLTQAVADARRGAEELGEASMLSAGLLRDMITNASEQVRSLADDVRKEQDGLGDKAQAALQAVVAGAAEAQAAVEAQGRESVAALAKAAEAARTASSGHIEAARRQVEELGEAAFAAGQKADQVFDARIAQSRTAIEQAAALVEEAGARSASRIEAGLDATRAALGELAGLLSEIDTRITQLPNDARLRAEAMRATVERGLGELTASARRASDETQAIDAAFQQRMRRNYEMLSEAVQLMGRATGAAIAAPAEPPARRPAADEDEFVSVAAAPSRRAAADPSPAKPQIRAQGGPAPTFGRAGGRAKDDGLVLDTPADAAVDEDVFEPALELTDEALEPTPAPAPAPAPQRAAREAPEDEAAAEPDDRQTPSLRPRLKLTPTADDQTLKTIFEPKPAPKAAPAPAPAPETAASGDWERELDEWTWKDLLSSMEEETEDEDALADHLLTEIEALGLDAAALLPRSRVEEIAERMQFDDPTSARDSVRRLAPGAIRRLSRRVLTDRTLREQTDRYVRRYQKLLRDSARKDEMMAATLLCSNPGRAFLLLDAAVGDLN